ncbi:MAG: hypothetical protein WCJ35_22735 [Planctomycetota bacterium]
MHFENDTVVAEGLEGFFGNYRGTFRSESGQVTAHLFEQDGWLIAHVSMPMGMEVDEITDPYLGELHDYARKYGFETRLRIVYAE